MPLKIQIYLMMIDKLPKLIIGFCMQIDFGLHHLIRQSEVGLNGGIFTSRSRCMNLVVLVIMSWYRAKYFPAQTNLKLSQ